MTKFHDEIPRQPIGIGNSFNPLPPSDAFREKFSLEHLFSSAFPQLKKYHPSRNLKFNNLRTVKSLHMRILVEKIVSISLKLNFTPYTSGWYVLWNRVKT